MQLNSVKESGKLYFAYGKNEKQNMGKILVAQNNALPINKINAENIKANSPIAFKGNTPTIKNAYIITEDENNIPLLKTYENGSYLIDFDSQTEVIYGLEAIEFLKNKSFFEYDTQIIFPKKSSGKLTLKDREIKLEENSAILINAQSEAKIGTVRGYPVVVMTKKDYDWYEHHDKNSPNPKIQDKFKELTYKNSHAYNGEFEMSDFLPEKMQDRNFLNTIQIDKWNSRHSLVEDIHAKKDLLNEEDRKTIEFIKTTLDKLRSKDMLEERKDGHFRLKKPYEKNYLIENMKQNGFQDSEIELLVPIFDKARNIKMTTKYALKDSSKNYTPETIEKMKEKGILHNHKKDIGDTIYWKKCYPHKPELQEELRNLGFSESEQEEILNGWQKANLAGFDLTGLKFINENIAVYNLNEKINNWNGVKTNWVTNSTALATQNGKTPFIGVSMVQTDEIKAQKMSELRKGEILHTHPNSNDRRQSEIYLITSGVAALNVIKNNKPHIEILKEGDLAVVSAGVAHCINSVLGEYEHVVVQLPSAFQYGFEFKQIAHNQENYNKEDLEKEALEILDGMKDK